MSVEVRCDRCGKVIPNADDIVLVGFEHSPYWEAMTYRNLQDEVATRPMAKLPVKVTICWSCEDKLRTWLKGEKS
jgi:ribosomal protein S26